MRKLILTLLLLLSFVVAHAIGFDGVTYEPGQQYYLFNVYQNKFVHLNTANRALTLDSRQPSLFTIEGAATSGVTLTVDGTSLSQTFTLKTVTEGYNFILSGQSTKGLLYDKGVDCTIDELSSGYNNDKAIWRLVSPEQFAAYQAKKRFSVAALNVDGMPKNIRVLGIINIDLNPDAKEGPGATAIGQKLKTMGWDVVGLSEDFNYHSQIWDAAWNDGVETDDLCSYNSTTHRGNISATAQAIGRIIAQQSPVFDIDGLCLFYRHQRVNGELLTQSESWTHWNEHYGYTSDGADGLIDKGYRYYMVQMQDGAEFDLYILHMDAETSPQDNAARQSQIIQLADAIKASQNKRPIIVMGDTNCRYTRDNLQQHFINSLNVDPRFTVHDAWIEFARNGEYPALNSSALMVDNLGYRKGEVVDKIFYINNTESDIRISPLTFGQDLSFINEQGEPLADHWPMACEFEYHTYDPAIDDADKGEFDGQTFYLRNVKTGYFLKAGGQNATHAVQGTYGTPITFVSAGATDKYALLTPMGALSQGLDPYMDQPAAIWTLVKQRTNGVYALTYPNESQTYGLSSKTSAELPMLPNVSPVVCSAYTSSSTYHRWELLTADQLKEEMMANASEEAPYNCTFLLGGANFDQGDPAGQDAWQGWPADETRMWRTFGGLVEDAYGNPCAEVYVKECNESGAECEHETKWNISQQLNGLPKGTYMLTAQAFQRINYDPQATADMVIYAQGTEEQTASVPLMYAEPQVTDEAMGSTKEGDYYYPNTMVEASRYFNAGYYQVSIDAVEVEDGTLTVGIAKRSASDKASTAWGCFDNFQLFYLGDHSQTSIDVTKIYAPASSLIYTLDGRRVTGTPQPGHIYLQGGKKFLTK